VVSFTALPIGEYAAVTLLLFFGLKSIKDAWDLPPSEVKADKKGGPELDEYAEAEELVKEKVRSQRLQSLGRPWSPLSTCDWLMCYPVAKKSLVFCLFLQGKG